MEKYHLLTCNENWADEHNVPGLAVMNEKDYKQWSKVKIHASAYLGNNGDGWFDDNRGLTGKELIKSGFVQHYNVTEEFAKTFKRTYLESLSLTNIFRLDDQYNDDEDEEDYDEYDDCAHDDI